MTLDLQIDTTELKALARRYEGAESMIEAEMRKAMQQSVDLVEGQVKGLTPVNTGALRNSIGRITSSMKIKGDLFNMRGLVMSPLVYAVVVEKGRGKNKTPPPVGPIELWVIRKGIAEKGDESELAAIMIAKSIGKKGIPAVKMFEEGLEASEASIEKIWLKATKRIAAKLDKLDQ